jgi:nicotinamidase-related amidase
VAREAGAPVVAVQTWRLDPAGDRVPVEGDELIEGLAALATDVVTKHSWGAFGGTQLDAVLRRRRVDHVVLAGIATNFGVESTARAADDLGYALTLVEAGMTTRTAQAHAFSVETILPALGTVAGEDDATRVLRGDPR